MLQIVFNKISAAEVSSIPTLEQLDLLGDFQVSESTLQTLDDARFGKMEKDGKILYRYVAKDYRIYFEVIEVESVWAKYGKIVPCSGNTSIFIYPGIELKAIDGLITNFHLPESTLIMLIAAFYGYDKTMAAYKVAVEEKYRFFSFGDAMFIR